MSLFELGLFVEQHFMRYTKITQESIYVYNQLSSETAMFANVGLESASQSVLQCYAWKDGLKCTLSK